MIMLLQNLLFTRKQNCSFKKVVTHKKYPFKKSSCSHKNLIIPVKINYNFENTSKKSLLKGTCIV